MKRLIGLGFVAFLLSAPSGSAQQPEARDLYKPVVERLGLLEMMQIPEWPYHEDMAHPEAPSVNEASWLNDCKYGCDAKGNVLRLSLLRSPEWPDPHADEGRHEFIYSLYPHGGNWRDAMTVQQGYELNYPLLTRQIEKHDGELKDEFSFLGVEQDNVVVTAMKRAEKEDAVILRFYEWAGKESDVKLSLPAGADDASETDLMERPTGKLAVSSGAVSVHTRPYEIKTVQIHFSKGLNAKSQ